MPLVSVLTVNYNQRQVTEELLHSLRHVNSFSDLEIIVVDNHSQSDPLPRWKDKYPGVRFIRTHHNLGFAGGNNVGMQQAKGKYVLLINNDTEVTESLIGQLVTTMENNPTVGVVSPGILFYHQPSTFQYRGYTPMNYLTGRNKTIGLGEKDQHQNEYEGPTGYAHGAAMMVRISAIEKAGRMDERFFLYYEELDWCEKIRKAGFEIWVNTNARIYHKESMAVGKSSPLKEYYMWRNRILFQRRHAPAFVFPFFVTYFLGISTPINVLRHLIHGRWRLISPMLKGITWNLFSKKY